MASMRMQFFVISNVQKYYYSGDNSRAFLNWGLQYIINRNLGIHTPGELTYFNCLRYGQFH